MSFNRKRFLVCALAAYLLTPPPSSGHGLEDADGSGRHWLQDSAITVAITSKLIATRFSTITHLRVRTDMGGVVSLSGTTGSRREADRAVAIARGTGGVLRVKNGIVVQARAK